MYDLLEKESKQECNAFDVLGDRLIFDLEHL